MEELVLTGELAASLAGLEQDDLKARLHTEEGELKPDAAKIFTVLVADKFKSHERDVKKQQYNRGIREAKESAEGAVKPLFEKYGVTDFDRFEDAIEELSEKLKEIQAGAPKGDPQELNEEEIRKHPAFKTALENEIGSVRDAWEKKYSDKEQEFDTYRSNMERKELQKIVYSSTRSSLESDGQQPIYGQGNKSDPDTAISMFWAHHGYDNVKLDDNDKPVLLDRDGNPARDEMGNPVSFGKFVNDNWLLGFKEAAGNGSPPHGGRGGGNGAPLVIRSEADFKNRLKHAKDTKERSEIKAAWAEQLRKAESP